MKEAKNVLVVIVLTVSVFFLIFIPLEFQITEVWMLTTQIHSLVGSLFLLFLAFIFGLVRWEKLIEKKLFLILLFVFLIAGIFVFKEYRGKKITREFLPKVYKVNREWGIQAQIVKINGVNFFPAWKKGKVVVGDQEMTIKSWDEKFIVAEQQVPFKFGWFELYIVRDDGLQSNGIPFEIKDPSNLF